MNGTTYGSYTTPISTYDINGYVTVSYFDMKPPSQFGFEVIAGDPDSDNPDSPKPRSKSFLFNRSLSMDENDNAAKENGPDVTSTPISTTGLPELVNTNGYPEPEPPVDVVIVGAGLSGLTAAYHMLKSQPDLKLVILEAKDNVGGRTYSPMLNTATGTRRFDLGDQWVNTEQRNILELIDALQLDTYPEHKEGRNILIYPDGVSEEYEGNIYPINPLRRLDISSFISRIESMRTDLSKKDPTDLSESLEWDSVTLEQFKKDHIWTDAARQVFDALVVFHFGVTPREMSLLFFCHVLNSVGGWKVLFGEDQEFPISRQLKIKGGAQHLCETLATEVGRSNLRLSDPVTTIDQSDGELVSVSTESGCRYRSKRVVVATSIHHSVRINYSPQIPLKRERLTSLMPAGHCIKYVVTYDKAFWRKNGLSGHVLKLTDEEKAFDTDEDLLGYEFVYDACACNRDEKAKSPENPALMGLIFSETVQQLTREERRRRILKNLAELFGTEAQKYIDYAEMDWGLDRYTNGYPFSAMMPGALVYHGKSVKKPHERVHWCGTEMASSWYGYMEGSVKSGKRVASEVRKQLNGPQATRE